MWKLGLSWQHNLFLPVIKHEQNVRKILRGREGLGVMIIESGNHLEILWRTRPISCQGPKLSLMSSKKLEELPQSESSLILVREGGDIYIFITEWITLSTG